MAEGRNDAHCTLQQCESRDGGRAAKIGREVLRSLEQHDSSTRGGVFSVLHQSFCVCRWVTNVGYRSPRAAYVLPFTAPYAA